MVTQTTKKASPNGASAPKKRSSGGFKKGKPTAYNKFMSAELVRLKISGVEDAGERKKMALKRWHVVKTETSTATSSSSP